MARKRLLDRIKDSLAQEGIKARSNAAVEWLKQKVKEIKLNITAREAFINAAGKSLNSIRNRYFIGAMYLYFYDPKLKEELPYYDRIPLVIPIEQYHDGFLGLNLHYISPKDRIILLDKLSTIATDDRYDDKTRFRISYAYLKHYSRAFEATPCLKRYLWSHVRSKFLPISADEWDIAALLNLERFVKATSQQVWEDSRKKYR